MPKDDIDSVNLAWHVQEETKFYLVCNECQLLFDDQNDPSSDSRTVAEKALAKGWKLWHTSPLCKECYDKKTQEKLAAGSPESASKLRHQALDEWLEKHNAVFRWAEEIKGVGIFKGYIVNGTLIMIQDLGHFGWEIYVPASRQNNVIKTLRAAETACGITGG